MSKTIDEVRADSYEPFALRNDHEASSKAAFENNTGQQRVLFSGLDCLPGQQDLFPTDGGADESHCHDQDRST